MSFNMLLLYINAPLCNISRNNVFWRWSSAPANVQSTARRRRHQEATTILPGRRYVPESDNVGHYE